jgi:hypothetical protein
LARFDTAGFSYTGTMPDGVEGVADREASRCSASRADSAINMKMTASGARA